MVTMTGMFKMIQQSKKSKFISTENNTFTTNINVNEMQTEYCEYHFVQTMMNIRKIISVN